MKGFRRILSLSLLAVVIFIAGRALRGPGPQPVPGQEGVVARGTVGPGALGRSDPDPAPGSTKVAQRSAKTVPTVAASHAVPTKPPSELAGLLEALVESPDEDRAEKLLEIARRWSVSDPAGALAWAFTLESGSDRAVVGTVLRDWVRRNPGQALESIRSMGVDRPALRDYSERLLFSHWANTDPASAWEAAGAIADARTRAAVKGDILFGWSESDPQLTASTLDTIISSSSEIQDFVSAFSATAGNLAMKDPGHAAAWAVSLPEGEARNAAVSGVIGTWLQLDFGAATAWLNTLDAGQARDAGIGRLVLTARNRQPETAFEWAETMADPIERTRYTTLASLSWLARDSQSARAAIDASTVMSVGEKEAIWAAHADLSE